MSSGSAASPSSGNQIVSGRPTSTGSSGRISGSARKIASHKPPGFGLHT